jgi:RNA polymerase sigma factor (sigma-70 family)
METVVLTGEEARGEAVIEACKQGDREAFRRLFERHKDRVYCVALYFFGGDEATAADVTQQVFLKLFTRIDQFQGEAEFTTWLHRLTTNACVDEQRKRGRVRQFGEGEELREPFGGVTQEERVARAEVGRAVGRAVPAGVTRDGINGLDRAMLDAWKAALESNWLDESTPAIRRVWRGLWR